MLQTWLEIWAIKRNPGTFLLISISVESFCKLLISVGVYSGISSKNVPRALFLKRFKEKTLCQANAPLPFPKRVEYRTNVSNVLGMRVFAGSVCIAHRSAQTSGDNPCLI